jgi:arabinose-5-phosphate isomerase
MSVRLTGDTGFDLGRKLAVKMSLHSSELSDHRASLDDARAVVNASIDMLSSLRDTLDLRMLVAAQQLASCKGRLVVSGVGKSGISARKIASTCASLGIPSLFLHPADAAHGDLGMLTEGDILLCISVSGDSVELVSMMGHAERLGVVAIAITSEEASPLARQASIILPLPKSPEGGPLPMVPMASTLATIAIGDALATLTAKLRAFSPHQLAALHPAGRIGKKLKPLQSVMHSGLRMPCVAPTASLGDVVREIGEKGFGIVAVIEADSGKLLGSISDGDLRRLHAVAEGSVAHELMTVAPQTLYPEDGADEAMELIRTHRIGAVFVTEPDTQRLVGIVHVHDLLRLGLV